MKRSICGGGRLERFSYIYIYIYIYMLQICLLLFYVQAIYKVMAGQVLTSDSVHSWRLYSAPSVGHQAAGTTTRYPTQSHYPDAEPTSFCPILIMPSVRLGNDKYQLQSKSLVWLDEVSNPSAIFGFTDRPKREAVTLLIWPPPTGLMLQVEILILKSWTP